MSKIGICLITAYFQKKKIDKKPPAKNIENVLLEENNRYFRKASW